MTSTLVTQSFGNEREYRRAIFMVWSFWAYTPTSSRVILFTDRPDFFRPYFSGQPVEYVLLSPEKIKSMRGSIDFLHRMKIVMIEEAFSISKTNVLYADSDTFFINDPSPLMANLSPSVAYMHEREYNFEEMRYMPLPAGETFRALVSLLDTNTFVLASGSSLKLSTYQSSWNAGVMMFHPVHKALLPDVYSLTDQFYPPTRNHASEQYAFSIVFQNNTDLSSCKEIAYHYWYRVKKLIADEFLEKNVGILLLLDIEEKIDLIKKWTSYLQFRFDNHVWMLRDQSIQSFNKGEFKQGYAFAARAFLKNPFSFSFNMDVLYHTKRQIKKLFK